MTEKPQSYSELRALVKWIGKIAIFIVKGIWKIIIKTAHGIIYLDEHRKIKSEKQ